MRSHFWADRDLLVSLRTWCADEWRSLFRSSASFRRVRRGPSNIRRVRACMTISRSSKATRRTPTVSGGVQPWRPATRLRQRQRDRKGLGRSSVGRRTRAIGRSHLRADLPPGAPATLRGLRTASLRTATKRDRGRLGLTTTVRLQVFCVNDPSHAGPLLWRVRTQLARFGPTTRMAL